MTVPLMWSAQASAHADDTSTQTFVVDNSTGATQDGTPMGAPGVKVGDTYYTVGSSAIAASAGGSSNLVLYGGKDWTHKKPVLDADGNEIVIAGPTAHFKDPNTGDEIYPFANAKSERVAFSQTPNGKFIVWVHWEMNSDYNASQTLGLIADKVTGPYTVYQNHQRPGASTVDAKGGHDVKSLDDSVLPSADLNTDAPDAFGDRVGKLIGDPYTIGADGNRLAKPAQASYPEAMQLYNTSNGGSPEVNDGSVNPVKWETQAGWNLSGDAGFGTSATGGNWWTFNFNDLHDTLRLKTRAVRMTDWDASAWTAAEAAKDPDGDNGSLTASAYVQRYPAVKTDDPADEGKYAAGVDGSAYAGKTTDGVDAVVSPQDASAGVGAYDPNVKDGIVPEVGAIDASKTSSTAVSVDKDKPSDGADAAKPAAPLLSPQLSENKVGGALMLRGNSDPQKADAIYATNTSPATYDSTIWLTNDGSDPTDPNNPNRIAYNTRWNPYPIVVTQDNAGSTLVDGEFTIKAAAQTGSDDTGDLKYSDVVSQKFQYAKQGTSEYDNVPIFQPVSTHPAGSYQNSPGYQEIKVFEPTYGTEVYYTMDNSTPTPARYGQNIGYGSRDYTIINDTVESGGDGKAYFVTAADDQYMRVWQLNDNMTAVVSDKEYDLDVGKHREAPQLIRGPHGNYLYMLTSGQSGWYANQAEYQRTTGRFISDGFDNSTYPRDKYGYRDGSGSWTSLQPFADGTTYNSQVGGVYNLGTKDEPNYLFSGSHWVVGDLEDSYSIWLPMTIDDDADGTGAQAADQMVSVDGFGDQGVAATSSFPVYKPDKGLVTVKYSGKVLITLDANGKGSVRTDPTEENIKFDIPNTYADLKTPAFEANPDNHTPRVIDYQQEQRFSPQKCDIPDTNGWQTCNDGVSGEGKADAATWTNAAGYLLGTDGQPLKDAKGNLIRDPSQVADQSTIKRTSLKDAGIIRNYGLKAAFDGKDWDLDNYDGNEQLYQGTGNDFFTTFDLGQERDLSTIGLSFKSVGGSDNAHRYGIYATNDVDAHGNPTNWKIIANNKQNNVPGFQAHNLDGDTYRYVKYENVDNVDMTHGKTGQSWSRGLYEMTISAKKVIPLDVTAFKSAVAQGTTLSQMTDTFTAKSLKALDDKLTVAQRLLDDLQHEGTATKHTQDEIDTATTQLTNAIKNLQTVGSAAPVDFTALAKAIDDGQSKLDQSANYTPGSVKALQDAINEGKDVLAQVDDPELKQAQVDEATAKIGDAIAGLKLATAGPAIKKVSVADGDTVKGKKTFAVTLGGDPADVSYTYIELNKGASHTWVTDNTKSPGSSNSGLNPTLTVDTRALPNGTYGLKIDAVGTNGKTTEKTVSFKIANKGLPTIAAAASSTKFGTSAKVTVKATGPGGTPTGTIRVTDGKTAVGSAKLASGKATVTVSKDLAVGSHTLTVTYSGDKAFKASTNAVKVKVAKASSKTAVSVSPKSPKHTERATVTAKITTVKPTGSAAINVTHKVKETVVRNGKKVTKTTTKTVVSKKVTVSSKGEASLTLPKLAKGTYTVTATYSGSSTATSSKASKDLSVK
ncbi:Ig-like domain repeat protein [Streptomyces evansiae]|uniref:Ig-like domain repeat protein n=1 Tax=Streptomyces evansiae TaxID=3075535 RepID=UPI00288594A3|nr:Ig-like domain repeat protein [Streptomyces sp. DSM 41859]MDT0425205.1 Ig-like domain repeat protein [Streptomyces sp. DSM 41859]